MFVERVRKFHLRPMTALLHLEYANIWNEFGNRSCGFKKYILVEDVGFEQRQNVRHRALHFGPCVKRKPRRDNIIPNLCFIMKQALEDLADIVPCRISRGYGSRFADDALHGPRWKVTGCRKQNKPFHLRVWREKCRNAGLLIPGVVGPRQMFLSIPARCRSDRPFYANRRARKCHCRYGLRPRWTHLCTGKSIPDRMGGSRLADGSAPLSARTTFSLIVKRSAGHQRGGRGKRGCVKDVRQNTPTSVFLIGFILLWRA